MDIKTIKINKPDDVNMIIGQAHFIKAVEDLYEAVICAAPGVKFGIAFCESSGACKIRVEGNDEELKKIAVDNALQVGAGHAFFIAMRQGFPIHILNQVKNTMEVCSVFTASANPLEVIVADNGSGRGILGVIDGLRPQGVEEKKDVIWRTELLRKIGYKK